MKLVRGGRASSDQGLSFSPEEEPVRHHETQALFCKVQAKLALEAIREELTKAELAKKYDIHPTMIGGLKRTAIENMAAVFGDTSSAQPEISAGEVEKLHAKIAQLVIERDFLRGTSSLILGLEAKSGETGSS